MRRIFIANFPFSYTEETLRGLFSNYGQVEEVAIIKEKLTGKSKGFAYVQMQTEEEATKAIEGVNQSNHDGRVIHCELAKKREDSKQQYNFLGV